MVHGHNTYIILIIFISSANVQLSFGGIPHSCGFTTSDKIVFFTIEYGHGGVKNVRSPIGKLEGGQLALDVRPDAIPAAFYVSGEFYTNSTDPTHHHEISGTVLLHCQYSTFLFNKRLNHFVGPGVGNLSVPQETDGSKKGVLLDIEAGLNAILLWKFRVYLTYKYLYAKKTELHWF